tara:strand:- start:102 stop:1160 length:1059 start_codon:yes stop_codon:yes gene_type:complete
MPDNNRIFYACQAVYVDGTYLQNVQAVGIDYSADATGISDTGRSQQQRSIYSKPEISISIQREVNTTALPFYTPASVTNYANAYILKNGNLGTSGWDSSSLLKEYAIEVAYGSDDMSGNIESTTLRHCLLTEVSYEISVDGRMTENLSFVTRNLIKTGSAAAPIATPLSGTVFQRRHLDVENEDFILPSEVKSVVDVENDAGDDVARAVQSISINATFDYGEMTDVGKWRGSNQTSLPTEQNKWRYITTPIGITCEITAVVRKSIEQNILIKDTNFMGDFPTPNREIKIVMGHESSKFVIDLGKRNYLTGVSFSGGDVGGGNVEATFSYANTNNDFVPYKGTPVTLTQSTKY